VKLTASVIKSVTGGVALVEALGRGESEIGRCREGVTAAMSLGIREEMMATS